MQPAVSTLLRDYLETVDSIHGAYLDATTGFLCLVDEYDSARTKMLASRPNIPAEAFDNASLTYGTGHPRQPKSKVVHACTQGEYRKRNAEGGQNHKVIGQLCLVQMFGYWEDWYRNKLAECCGRQKSDLKVDVMGDLRLLRISIIHHRGIALEDIERCKILNWFHEGDEIALIPEHFETIVSRIKSDVPANVATL